MKAVLCLGSNDGPRETQILDAARTLVQALGDEGLSCSDLYGDAAATTPSEDFYNLVIALSIRPEIQTQEIEGLLKRIENAMGRRRGQPGVAIDIDLLALHDGELRWTPRYDPTLPFVKYGMAQLTLPGLQRSRAGSDVRFAGYPIVERNVVRKAILALTVLPLQFAAWPQEP